MFLFLRLVPMISMFEMRTILPSAKVKPEGRPLGRLWSCTTSKSQNKTWGLMAQFDSATAIVDAARRAREAGYTKIDAYSPFPIHRAGRGAAPAADRSCRGSSSAAASRARWAGWRSRYWASVIEYPMNIGGRPFASWVSFIIPAYETTILLASLTAVIGMIALNGLPLPYHPVFNVPEFSQRERRSLLPDHRDERPEVRRGRDARVSSKACIRWECPTLPRKGLASLARLPHSPWLALTRRRLPSGHARHAARRGQRGDRRLRGRSRQSSAGRRHRRARLAQRRRAADDGQGRTASWSTSSRSR